MTNPNAASPVQEPEGHEITVMEPLPIFELPEGAVVVMCECNWAVAAWPEKVDEAKQLHWIAKNVERDVLG